MGIAIFQVLNLGLIKYVVEMLVLKYRPNVLVLVVIRNNI
jgi:hypothetical protein